MNELDERRSLDMSLRAPAAGSSGEHDQEWPQPLATAGDDVRRDLVDEGYATLQARSDHSIHGIEIALDQGTDFIEGHG